MKKFQFTKDENSPDTVFSGEVFYNIYKKADFLLHNDHIETILSKGYQLRKMLKDVQPGETVAIEGVWLEKHIPLLVRKTGPNVMIQNNEFTANRLSGLTAAYAFDNRLKFPVIKSSEADILGLTWDSNNKDSCRLYLSAVSGTEHFWDQFGYWPLVCALRKLHLSKITIEPVVKMAKIKNKNGNTMGSSVRRKLKNVQQLWKRFPGSSGQDFLMAYSSLPPSLKKVICAD